MPEESSFRKYACPKLKLSRLLLDNLFRILVQNLSALEELKNCGIAELRKTLVAELRKTWVSQKRKRAILREIFFANDCANCCFFFAQNWCAKKEKFCVSFRKQFCEWKPYKKQTTIKVFIIQRQNLMNLNRQPGKIVCWLKFWKLNQPCLNHKDSLNLVSDFLTLG